MGMYRSYETLWRSTHHISKLLVLFIRKYSLKRTTVQNQDPKAAGDIEKGETSGSPADETLTSNTPAQLESHDTQSVELGSNEKEPRSDTDGIKRDKTGNV